ncbi:hypothetical protein [Roseiconus lacunae]|uniref:hypothetical protein n=1 Tax=Roseiconus lacunae TaxID=2605694 RepID=UPI001E4808EA|nr:hypothetical protein [Roseiconus lacunae]MCD0459107.1 hypothetical protein [Roseiconus lacunae]
MSGTPVYPGGSNTFIPNHRATSNLVIGFSRNQSDFAINEYISLKPVDQDQGRYLRITTEEAGRILDSELSEFVWPDGADRPMNNDGTELFSFDGYRTKRYDFGYKLGKKSSEQAEWDIGKSHQAIKAQQAMTGRTVRVHSVLASASSWEANHRKDVSTITGNSGPWDVSTTVRQDIKRSLNHAAEQIMLSTLSVVKKKDLRLVLSPPTAHRISECQEIVDHIKGSPEAYSQVRGGTGRWSEWGLPNELYGFKIVVEDAAKVTSRRGAATSTRQFVMPAGVAYLMSRPGGLVAPAGDGPNFSTISYFAYEEMTVEEFDDTKNRRLEGHVVDDGVPVQTASVSGFKFEGITS